MADKRRYARTSCAELVNISAETRKDPATIVRELSPTGMLICSRSKFAVGERVELLAHVSNKGYIKTTGRVVRSGLPPIYDCAFPYPAAIELDGVHPELAAT